MKFIQSGLAKNSCLLLLFILTLVKVFFNPYFALPIFLSLFTLLSSAYLVFSIIQIKIELKKTELPVERYPYLPYGIIAKNTIKWASLILIGITLYYSKSALVYLSVLLFLIALADMIIFSFRFVNNMYYISLFANYICFHLNDTEKLFASHIFEVQFRYNIFYFTTKTNVVRMIELEKIPLAQRESFRKELLDWGTRNNINFSQEARSLLFF